MYRDNQDILLYSNTSDATENMSVRVVSKAGIIFPSPCHTAPPAACHPPSAASGGPAADDQSAGRPGRRS